MKKCLAIILMLSFAAVGFTQTQKKPVKTKSVVKKIAAADSAVTSKTTTSSDSSVAVNNNSSSNSNTNSSNNNNSNSSAISKGLNALGGILGAGEQGGSLSSLTNTDIVNGLKEALEKGAVKSGDKLSMVDGFFANAALKILMPPEAIKVEKTLRDMGMGNVVDDAILAMNRAAEDAAKSASPIFINAIKSISINDALGILKGSDTAATSYLRSKTVSPLTEAFRPVIENSLAKVDATKYWKTIFSTYNMVAFKKINPDLSAYVTERALSGIFIQLGQEEAEIRKNPLARTSTLLQKVFGSK